MKMRIEDNRAAGYRSQLAANRTNPSLTLGIDLSTEFRTAVQQSGKNCGVQPRGR